MSATVAEQLLMSLGIDRAEDINLEMIAWSLGAKVRYRALCSCEARVCGHGDKAIITVDDRKSPQRVRFSVAHEIGHWVHHRGRLLICRAGDIGKPSGSRRSATDPESVADQFASDLLLPSFILRPWLADIRTLNLKGVQTIASAFGVSRTATAIRIMDSGRFHAMIVCHGFDRRRWFRPSRLVPERWFPKDELDPESYAFEVLKTRVGQPHPRKIGADAWFDRTEAVRFEITEQSFPLPNDEVLTLLTFPDSDMMEDRSGRSRAGYFNR